MDAGMKLLGNLVFGLLVLGYVVPWTFFAIIMAFALEAPRNWIGWTVVVANPFLLALIAGLFLRHRQRGRVHG